MKKGHYINNKEFEDLIEIYLKDPKSVEDKLMPMFDTLITNILGSFNFKVDLEDAKQDCFVLIFKIMKNFHPKKGTAFNFFTTVIVNNLKLTYSKDKNYKNKLATYFEKNKDNLFES
jgi:DNA-directed RNA polymerase specialized sigma subunit